MDSHDRCKLFFSIVVLIFPLSPQTQAFRRGRVILSSNMAPNMQPVSSLGAASAQIADPPTNFVSFLPSGPEASSEAISISANEMLMSIDEKPGLNVLDNLDHSSNPVTKNVDPEVQKICDSTDYPSLCVRTVVPFLDDKTDLFSVLEAAVKASSELTKYAHSMAKKFANMPGVPPKIASILQDCKDSYDTALYNYKRASNALPDRDIGTLNTMLSAVITDIGDCEDELASSGSNSPLSSFAEKLTNMTSNCLAIASLLPN